MKNLTNSNIVKEIIENVKDDMQNEEIIHLVLEKQISHYDHQNITRGQKIADNIAKFGGSWYFIITFVILLISWMIYNQFSKNSLDPYPFILLNLILSCLSALQAPIIMMSQNRQEQIDRQRNENDYKVNLKTEIIIQDLHNKLDIILEELEKINNDEVKAIVYEMALKKYKVFSKRENDNYKLTQKLYRFLMGKGYDYDLIKDVVKSIVKSEDFE